MRAFLIGLSLSALLLGSVLFSPFASNALDGIVHGQTPQHPAVAGLLAGKEEDSRLTDARTDLGPAHSTMPLSHKHAQLERAPAPASIQAGATGDPRNGQEVYRKCQACHSLEPGKNLLGPT